MLFDSKGRRYLVSLENKGEFHTHAGIVAHELILGQEEGTTVRSNHGARYIAVRPTLAELVLKMPRGAQVIYPKDLGPILIMADIFPGARVLEAGLGSGALSMTLLRAGADINGYELRPEFAARAVANVTGFLGQAALEHYHVEVRDVYEGISEKGLDRVVLDLPEPWRAVKHAAEALGQRHPCFLPSVHHPGHHVAGGADRSRLCHGGDGEVLSRSWHIEGQSVRPDHRMVGTPGS